MKKKVNFHLEYTWQRTFYYFCIRLLRLFPRLIYRNKEHRFLFILSPPYCGSTMLNQLLSSSRHVSSNNLLGTREGQLLPGVKHFMFLDDRWNESIKYPWIDVKKVWMRYWDHSKTIFLDKSIPNIMRVDEISKVFIPISYICFIRNPYAQVEGLMRRNGYDAKSAAEFAVKCLRYQRLNWNRSEALSFSYEELCDNPNKISLKISDFIPDLDDINFKMKFTSHNYKTDQPMRMRNLNDEKISKISESDLKIINKVFLPHENLLETFNYTIIER